MQQGYGKIQRVLRAVQARSKTERPDIMPVSSRSFADTYLAQHSALESLRENSDDDF